LTPAATVVKDFYDGSMATGTTQGPPGSCLVRDVFLTLPKMRMILRAKYWFSANIEDGLTSFSVFIFN
jgi:hypothetical protein